MKGVLCNNCQIWIVQFDLQSNFLLGWRRRLRTHSRTKIYAKEFWRNEIKASPQLLHEYYPLLVYRDAIILERSWKSDVPYVGTYPLFPFFWSISISLWCMYRDMKGKYMLCGWLGRKKYDWNPVWEFSKNSHTDPNSSLKYRTSFQILKICWKCHKETDTNKRKVIWIKPNKEIIWMKGSGVINEENGCSI